MLQHRVEGVPKHRKCKGRARAVGLRSGLDGYVVVLVQVGWIVREFMVGWQAAGCASLLKRSDPRNTGGGLCGCMMMMMTVIHNLKRIALCLPQTQQLGAVAPLFAFYRRLDITPVW
jgi:hypothetical protein